MVPINCPTEVDRLRAERHTVRSYTRLLAGLTTGDPGGQVTAASIATQELRHVYGARDLTQARGRLFSYYRVCADSSVPELHRLARTITTWQDQLLAYFTTGQASNGPTEPVNLLITLCTAAPPGPLAAPHESGAAHHA